VAFTEAERDALGLTGRLPSAVLTLEQQALRAHGQLHQQGSDLAKNVYLEQHDRDEVLYYRVLGEHLSELRCRAVVRHVVSGHAVRLSSGSARWLNAAYLRTSPMIRVGWPSGGGSRCRPGPFVPSELCWLSELPWLSAPRTPAPSCST